MVEPKGIVTINGEDVVYSECWHNLSVKQYQEFLRWEPEKPIEDRNYFELFSILAGKKYASFKDTYENQQTLWNIVNWIIETPLPGNELPKVLQIEGRETIDVPREIKYLSIGQNICARQVIDKALVFKNKQTGEFLDADCYSMVVAIYLQPLLEKAEFDLKKAKALEPLIASMPITLIRPIGFFLLKPVFPSGKSFIPKWLKTLISRKERRKKLSLS
jgi:hypothetical protein